MALLLMYNINGEKAVKIKLYAYKYGIKCREAAPAEFSLPLSALASSSESSAAEAETATPFTDEMLVMCGLSQPQFNSFLDSIRTGRAGVALKAVLTETNSDWTAEQLHRELLAEREAYLAMGRAAAKHPVHKKK